MKTINYTDFAAHLPEVVSTVTGLGDLVRVINKNGENFVLIEETQYKSMLEAMRMMFAASGAVNPDEQTISIAEMNHNWGIMR